MARRGLLLAALAAVLAAAAPSAEAGQFASQSFGLAGTAGTANLPGHANAFFRDGLASQCNDGMTIGGSPAMTPGPFAYKSRAFTSLVNEPVCVTMAVSAPTCMGTDAELMSETYSPAYDPADITHNWIGDLGNSPPGSYSVVVAAGAHFETVADEVNTAANCGGVNIAWSSDRPWANSRPFPSGLPAVGQTLTASVDAWAGDPAVGRQWKRCDAAGGSCSDIPGATGPSYVLTDDDIGHRIRVDESATEAALTSTVDGRTTETPVFIPAVAHEGQSLVAGDPAVVGSLSVAFTPSDCAAPKLAPATSGNEIHFYDVFAVASLINETACIRVAHIPRASGGFCNSTLVVYSPAFEPSDQRSNYVADDSRGGAPSATLAPGGSAQAVIFDDGMLHLCADYGLMIGSDAPFATGRPALSGDTRVGTPVTTTSGSWGGAPAFAYSWRRCDPTGGACVPIDGATGQAYTPTGADIGSTMRSRVTATQGGRSASSDSEPSGVVAAAAAPDRTAPKGTVRLGSRDLAKVVRSGRVPVRVTCDEACSAAVEVRVTRKLARSLGLRRKIVIAKAKGSTTAGRGKTLRAKLTARARRGMRRRNSLKVRLVARFTDEAGNKAQQVRRGTLRRPARRRR